MRISDWSSDVCSSDLFLKSWELARELLQLARASGDTELLLQAYSANTNIALWRNQIDDACRYARAAIAQPGIASRSTLEDRQIVVEGKNVSVRVALGCRRSIKTKNKHLRK